MYPCMHMHSMYVYYYTWLPEYQGYQGVFTGRLRWLRENRVAVTGTTESVSPLHLTLYVMHVSTIIYMAMM